MLRRTVLVVLLMSLVGSIMIQPALGKDFPTRPIEILVPYPPGSSADIPMRILADVAPKYLGQPLVVVNKTGAGGSIAAADTINSPADGYKLVELTNLFFATTVKTQKITFDPNHLIPIANFVGQIQGLAVKGDSPWKTLSELIDYGRKNPGKLRWAHVGRGTSIHMNGLLLFRKAGLETIDVPFPGAAEEVAALLGGHVDAIPISYSTIMSQMSAGQIRYLVTLSDRRYSRLPNVPSAVELGFPETAKLQTTFGLFVHKDTPQEIQKTLFEAFKKSSPDLDKKFEEVGLPPLFEGPEFIKKVIRESEEVGVPILKELKLYVGK